MNEWIKLLANRKYVLLNIDLRRKKGKNDQFTKNERTVQTGY